MDKEDKENKQRDISPAMMRKIAPIIRFSRAVNESLEKEPVPIIDLKNAEREVEEIKFQELKDLIQNRNPIVEKQTILNENQLDNPFPSIFSNFKSFQLFQKLNDNYSKEKNRYLSNYSFIYYAMQKDRFIVCNTVSYINFLSDNFQINIDKTDARQAGNNIRTATYNAYKDSLSIQST